jgi:hypothetical protein
VLFDSDGKAIFRFINNKKNLFKIRTPLTVRGGLILVDFPKPMPNDSLDWVQGLINFNGNVIYKDTSINYILEFDNEKAIVNTEKGNEVVFFEKRTDKAVYPIFDNAPDFFNLKKYGLATASVEQFGKQKWGIIDSCFNWKLAPQYDLIQLDNSNLNRCYILTRRLSKEEAEKKAIIPKYKGFEPELRGLADKAGNVIFDANYEFIIPFDSTNTKFYVRYPDGKKSGIMDRNGTLLRENQAIADSNSTQLPPRFASQIYSKQEWKIAVHDTRCKAVISEESENLKSCNEFKKNLNSSVHVSDVAQISFSESDTIYTKLEGNSVKNKVIKAQLINPTNDTIFFSTNFKNELNIIVQAKDKNGKWRNISMVRGLSPYEKENKIKDLVVGLPPQYFWEIQLPTYNGFLNTKCRAIVRTSKKDAAPIVSKEWDAGINPAQFWRSPVYQPEKIFTAYNYMYDEGAD